MPEAESVTTQPIRRAGDKCPVTDCGGTLEERKSSVGRFLGCTNFFAKIPCKYTYKIE